MSSSVLDDCSGISAVFRSSDIIPALHLGNLAGKRSASLCIIGDSTSADGSGMAQSIDSSQIIWSALKTEFARQNPQISWNFQHIGQIPNDPGRGNYGIGGTWFGGFLQVGAELNPNNRPAWFADLSMTWLAYVKAARPDVLVICTGINLAELGTAKAHHTGNIMHQVKRVMLDIAGWENVPNIIFITNKIAHSTVISQPVYLEYQKAVAAAIRSFCRSSGNGIINASGITAAPLQQFGLIDIGRHFCSRVIGYDHDCQYMAKLPSATARGVRLGTVPVEIGTTYDDDFAMTLVFPGQGGTAMSGQLVGSGIGQLLITLGAYLGNILALNFAGEYFNLAYFVIANDDAGLSLRNGPIILPSGDLTVHISCKSEHIVVFINGNVVFDELVPRFICKGTVTIATKAEPVVAPTMHVSSFLSGYAVKSPIAISEDAFWGAYGATEMRFDGPYGGNNFLHSSSIGMVLDYEIIGGSNFAAPYPAPVSVKFRNMDDCKTYSRK